MKIWVLGEAQQHFFIFSSFHWIVCRGVHWREKCAQIMWELTWMRPMRWCTLSSCLHRKIVFLFGCTLLFLGSVSVYLCFRIECLLVASSWEDEASLHVYSVRACLVLLYIFFFFFSFHRLPQSLSGFRNKKIWSFLDFLVLGSMTCWCKWIHSLLFSKNRRVQFVSFPCAFSGAYST